MIITVYALFNGEKQRVVSKAKTLGGLKRAAFRARIGNGWGVQLESNVGVEETFRALRASAGADSFNVFGVMHRNCVHVARVEVLGWSADIFPCEVLCKEGSK